MTLSNATRRALLERIFGTAAPTVEPIEPEDQSYPPDDDDRRLYVTLLGQHGRRFGGKRWSPGERVVFAALPATTIVGYELTEQCDDGQRVVLATGDIAPPRTVNTGDTFSLDLKMEIA